MACERAKQERLIAVRIQIAWMNENYSGCDWCCGGGDERMSALLGELLELEPQPDAPAS